MCTNPIQIKNKSRRYKDGVSPMFFNVPCGHCYECRKKEQDDWFVRAFFEWKRVQKVGGHVFFPTFSYRNYDLPWYEDKERGFRIPCFDASHIKSFRDKLRVNLKRAGFPADGVRYILACEFGGSKGRPHIHGLIFVPFNISSCKMLKLLRKSWSHGWTMISNKGLEIQSVNAVQYAMKYVSKPTYWFKKYNIYWYLSELRQDKANNVLQADEIYKKFLSCLPHHYQSTGFGSDLVNELYFDKEEFLSGKVDLSKRGFVTGNKFKFGIPRYIVRKLMKDKDIYNTDVSSFYAKDVFQSLFDVQVSEQVKNLDFLKSFDSYRLHFSPLRLPESSYLSCWNKFYKIKDDLRSLVVYNFVYRDVPLSKDYPFADKQFLIDHACEFAMTQKFDYSMPTDMYCSASDVSPELFDKNRPTFGDLPFFRGFDSALDTLSDLNRLLNISVTSAYEVQEEISSSQYIEDKYIKF